jgi:hypothetical protein
MADREQRIHPVRCLVDLVVLIASGVVLPHAGDQIQDGHERPDGVRVPPEDEVGKADVVVGGNMAGCDAGEWRLHHNNASLGAEAHRVEKGEYLLAELDVLGHLEGEGKVAEQCVHTEKPDETEVTELAVERLSSVITNDFTRKLVRVVFQFTWRVAARV